MWRSTDGAPELRSGTSIALGVFDGVHRGHQQLLASAVDSSAAGEDGSGTVPVMVTFDPHPMEVLRPGDPPPILTGALRKAELAQSYGMAGMYVICFNTDIAAWSPTEFVDRILVEALSAKSVSVGSNFTFGAKASGDTQALQQLCAERSIACHVHELLADDDGTISSTAIRSAIDRGAVEHAAAMLGRPHRVEGTVVHGAGRGGRELGYPTANVDFAPNFAIPADGVYAGWFTITDEEPIDGSMYPGTSYPAAISVGTNPTFGGTKRTMEAFVLEENADLYHRQGAVDFVAHVRDMEKFTSVAELLVAMDRDVRRTRERLGLPALGADESAAQHPPISQKNS